MELKQIDALRKELKIDAEHMMSLNNKKKKAVNDRTLVFTLAGYLGLDHYCIGLE